MMDESKLQNLPHLKKNVSLADYSTFKVGGPAKYFVSPTTREEIAKVFKVVHELEIPYFILGGGSNLLISDNGFKGVVIKPNNKKITICEHRVTADAGVSFQKFIQKVVKANLTGLEHLSGIPGTLGGAIAGNAGTATKWINSTIKQVHVVDRKGEIIAIPKTQCDFSYRYSRFKNSQEEIIVGADFILHKGDPIEIRKKVKETVVKRNHQPAGDACAGCIFKNPAEAAAGKIIEDVGLKGKMIGGAMVSPDHANFIVNTGKATAEDIAILISLIKQQVRDNVGIQLQEEIKYIGF